MNRGAWRATVHGVTESWTRLSDSGGLAAQGLTISFSQERFGRVGDSDSMTHFRKMMYRG